MAEKSNEKSNEKPKDRLKEAMNLINKNYGDGSVMRGPSKIANVEAWPTGIASLDIATGAGGMPRGRIIELFGAESSGKTTLCLECIATCQQNMIGKHRGIAAFIDAEHAIDPEWAQRIGVQWTNLIFSQPDSGEQALDIVKILVESNSVDLIVVDSVAALVPQAELDGDITDNKIGLHARLMSKAMRMLTTKCSQTKTTIIFINQIREKIGVMFGSPETTPGGRALKFYSSMRLDVRRGKAIKQGGGESESDAETSKAPTIGFTTNVKIIKNKVGPPFKTASFNIMFGIDGHGPGIDRDHNLVMSALQAGVIEQNSSSYSFCGLKAQGKEKLYAVLRGRPDLVEQLREQTYKRLLSERSDQPFLDLSINGVMGVMGDQEAAALARQEQAAELEQAAEEAEESPGSEH